MIFRGFFQSKLLCDSMKRTDTLSIFTFLNKKSLSLLLWLSFILSQLSCVSIICKTPKMDFCDVHSNLSQAISCSFCSLGSGC